MAKAQDDVVLYSDLTTEIRSTKRFVARTLRTFSRTLDAKIDQRFLEFETHLPNGELTALREILPELKAMAVVRRRSEQGHAWLASLMPGWVAKWLDRLLAAIATTVIYFAIQHGWLTIPVLNHIGQRGGHP